MKRRLYKLSKFGPLTAYRLGLGPLLGKAILLLTTTGRKTGLPRVTPLQYELLDDKYFIGAALGLKADWVRNLVAEPKVRVRVKNKSFTAEAQVITDPSKIADFIQYRLKRRPRLIGLILRMDGVSSTPSREELEDYARNLVIVRLSPVE